MLVPNQKIEVHWCPANKEHYESLGYVYAGIRKPLIINAEELMENSQIRVKVVCDYCGRVYDTQYKIYLKGIHNNKSCCANCWRDKAKEINKELYGYENPFESKEIQQKIKQTNLEKYGVENIGQNEEIKEKIRQTNFEKYGTFTSILNPDVKAKALKSVQERYGVNNVFESPEFQNKIRETIKKKYNVTNVSLSPEIIEKRKETSKLKRGVDCPFQDPEVIKKIRSSLYKNGTTPISKAEQTMVSLLKELYGEDSVFPNYPIDKINLDCLVIVDNQKIDVEYDGWYWHKDRQEKDKRRNYFLIRRGYKVLRFVANNEIPSKELLKEKIDYLVKGNHHLKIVKLDI